MARAGLDQRRFRRQGQDRACGVRLTQCQQLNRTSSGLSGPLRNFASQLPIPRRANCANPSRKIANIRITCGKPNQKVHKVHGSKLCLTFKQSNLVKRPLGSTRKLECSPYHTHVPSPLPSLCIMSVRRHHPLTLTEWPTDRGGRHRRGGGGGGGGTPGQPSRRVRVDAPSPPARDRVRPTLSVPGRGNSQQTVSRSPTAITPDNRFQRG